MGPLKRLERNVTALFKLGRTEWMAKQASREVGRLSDEINALRHEKTALAQSIEGLRETLEQEMADRLRQMAGQMEKDRLTQQMGFDIHQASLAEVRRGFSDLSRRLDLLLHNGFLARAGQDAQPIHPDAGVSESRERPEGFQAYLDSFYHQLENRFRGSRADIKDRLRIYLPDVEAAVIRTGDKPVLDIGCGRGEWLELLSEAGLRAFGVDTNPVQIDDVDGAKLDIRCGDARQLLVDQADNSLAVITAHHLIEHLPFEEVAFITREAERVLAPGGLLIYETPNPRNILVGASSFYNDPTHRHPVTESVLQVLFESTGFHPVEMRPLHSHERLAEFQNRPGFDAELAHILFGPQDLAALGTKPLSASG